MIWKKEYVGKMRMELYGRKHMLEKGGRNDWEERIRKRNAVGMIWKKEYIGKMRKK